ncbi:MAG TPA: thioredoxin domain-containing protein [Bryobacteraceae bacterium]|nr:thioredoxin domain-containing protein [Bryobacteraceae bacterium]
MHTNHLAKEKSPYLLQHAHNPVDWYPWGPEAFDKARRENKPVFLSIGYSTCHWCHVMERESFENEQIAGILNRHFVSIKVDREERPDVDRVYMTFVQVTTGGGGWPMSVWLTPDLKPFFGGTYFPPEDRYGRAGFPQMLERIHEAWEQQQARILESSADIIAQLRKQMEVEPSGGAALLGLDPVALDNGFQVFRRTFDTEHAGFSEAPKFPRPVALNFLLRFHARTGNPEALEMVLATLREMAKGGMHDQLGGGFHRYSVDRRWFVPHFEKMLYDQAQLATSYLEAFQITGDQGYAETARRIFDYVLRDMLDPDGGFYSAEDADSVIDPAQPTVKGEGAFYIWKQSEVEIAAGVPAAEWFCYRYGVEEHGNVQEDPHHEFAGRNILYQAHSAEETARHFQRPLEEVRAGLALAEQKLLAARSRRVRPHLDDKVLTAWNGLMISALAKGGAILREPRYLEAARRAANFLASRMYQAETGMLLRRYRQGEAAIPGFLDDYAFFAQALLDLYEAEFEPEHLRLALRLMEQARDLFEDRVQGAFFSSRADDPDLILRIKEDYDGAEPSGNSIAVLNLLRLAQITGRADLRESAEKALGAFASRIQHAPVGVPQMLVALAFYLSKPRQIILVGAREAADTRALLGQLNGRFVPERIVLLVDGEPSRRLFAGWLPVVDTMRALDGKATAYVCEDYTCKLPANNPEKFGELLQ